MYEFLVIFLPVITMCLALITALMIRNVKVHINSRLTELLEMSKRAAHADGVAQERQDQERRSNGV